MNLRSATAESATSGGSVVLRSKKSQPPGGYADFLGKLAGTVSVEQKLDVEDEADDEQEEDVTGASAEARAARKAEALRRHTISVRRAWVERMEAEAAAEEAAEEAPAAAAAPWPLHRCPAVGGA